MTNAPAYFAGMSVSTKKGLVALVPGWRRPCPCRPSRCSSGRAVWQVVPEIQNLGNTENTVGEEIDKLSQPKLKTGIIKRS